MVNQENSGTTPDGNETTAQIRGRKIAQRDQEAEGVAQQQAAKLTRLAPHAVIATPNGRVPMGRTVRIQCPLYEGLWVTFRTDIKQKQLDDAVILEALVKVVREEGESLEDFQVRKFEALDHMTVKQWCKRLRARCIAFEGWNFGNVKVDADGDAIRDDMGEIQFDLIPVPDPLRWETYRVIATRESPLADLGVWCMAEGFQEALKASGNF